MRACCVHTSLGYAFVSSQHLKTEYLNRRERKLAVDQPCRSMVTVLTDLDGGDVVAWVRDDLELGNSHPRRCVSINPWPEGRVRQQLLEVFGVS